MNDDQIFGNDFIKVLLEPQKYSGQLTYKIFLPYCIFMISSLIYFSYYLPWEEVRGGFFGEAGYFEQAILRVINLLGAIALLLIEFN